MFRIANHYISLRQIFLVFLENLALLSALLLAIILEGSSSSAGGGHIILKAGMLAALCQLLLYLNDLYDIKVAKQQQELLVRLFRSFAIFCFVLAGACYLFPELTISSIGVMISLILIACSIVLLRMLFQCMARFQKLKERVLILGSGQYAIECAREILRQEELGMEVVGFAGENPSMIGTKLFNPQIIGTVAELEELVDKNNISRIVVALEDRRNKLPLKTLLDMKFKGIAIDDALSLLEKLTGKIYIDRLQPGWLIFAEGFRKSKFLTWQKRLFDILFSLIGLIVTFPIALVVALLIKLDSKGPVLFKQERVGEKGKVFKIIKFRSMRADAEERIGPTWAKEKDDRVTRVGKYLRLFRLDEIPQFINVLRGDMSLVGPRPERPFFVADLSKEIPYYAQRHSVRPGITGWAQVKYQYGSSAEDAMEKLRYDLFYIKNMSPLFDLLIILLSLKVVLSGKGAR